METAVVVVLLKTYVLTSVGVTITLRLLDLSIWIQVIVDPLVRAFHRTQAHASVDFPVPGGPTTRKLVPQPTVDSILFHNSTVSFRTNIWFVCLFIFPNSPSS